MDDWKSYSGMTNQIEFSKTQIRQLKEHSQKIAPNEACAVLFGVSENSRIIIKDIFFTKNIEESPVNFTIDEKELLEAYTKAEEKNLEVCGIFHSHPSSTAYPSSTDRKFMEINPVTWVIFSNSDDQFLSYIYDKDIIRVPLTIT